MESVAEREIASPWRKLVPWLPLAGLPMAATWIAADWPAWVFMWLLAISVFAGLKWLSVFSAPGASDLAVGRFWGYLCLWPGMDAKSFFDATKPVEHPRSKEWLLAFAKLGLGILFVIVAMITVARHPLIGGWIGLVGVAFVLHFGLFHLLSLAWRLNGVFAPPIMDAPILATSLSDFWGRRWNMAFRDVMHTHVFRPLVARFGFPGATVSVFLVSGIIHDLVISIPAKGGMGLPTLYFLIQALGVLTERSKLGQRIGLGNPIVRRLFCAGVTLGPVGLLFHRPFVERVVVPMFTFIGSVWI